MTTKPDWAERLQRTFSRKYIAGWKKGLSLGLLYGAIIERNRLVGLIQANPGRDPLELIKEASA